MNIELWSVKEKIKVLNNEITSFFLLSKVGFSMLVLVQSKKPMLNYILLNSLNNTNRGIDMKRIQDFFQMIREKRIGFLLDEVMTGEHSFEPGYGPDGKYPFRFKVTWGPKDIIKWANPFGGEFFTQPLEGTISIGGLCENAPCKGILELLYFTERKIRYKFDFLAGGKSYRYTGEKVNILPWNLPISHTTCFGTLVEKETGKLISRSIAYFRLWRGPQFLASFRLA